MLRQDIKAYFISHPHLDHIAGLIINSPDDSTKTIYGLPSCLSVLQTNYFTWKSWANFGDEVVRSVDSYLLYLGDTGPDSVEHSDKLHLLWNAVEPMVRNGRLKAIFIEVSFPNAVPDKSLFGHLTPRWLMREMQDLEQLAGPGKLRNLPVVITHIKPSGDQETIIRKELRENPFGLRLIFPEQGVRMDF